MSRLVLMLTFVIILIVCYPINNIEDATGSNNATIVFYIKDELYLDYGKTLQGGLGYEVEVDVEYAERARDELYGVMGESITINGDLTTAYSILEDLNAKIISEQQIDNILFINAYTRKLRNYIVSNNTKVNLQIAISDQIIIIGTPLIIGSC